MTDLNLGISTNVSIDKDLLVKGNLTISGILQSPLTNLLSISTANALTRNETTLPSSFTNSSLTTLGNLNGMVSTTGSFSSSNSFNSFDPNNVPIKLTGAGRPFYFNRRTSYDDEYNCLDFMGWNYGNPYTTIATFGYLRDHVGIGMTNPSSQLSVKEDCTIGTDLGVSRNITISGHTISISKLINY